MPDRRRSWWGWGWEGEGPDRRQKEAIAAGLAARLGLAELPVAEPARLEDLELPSPRVEAPPSISGFCSSGVYERASHSYGKSFRDVVRGFRGQLDHPPDVVAFPADETGLVAVLDWATGAGAAVVPYGGGSSVAGGVECDPGDRYAGVVCVDLGRLDRVLEVDRVSRAARIQGGVLGPSLEEQLRSHGLTLRHFPQSFEFSSLGGWLATRSGGHYATAHTHIDDFVESVRMVTPAGVVESRRLPGSGAGPSPDRLALGSEGALGVITEAWMRLQDRPRYRSSAAVRFADYGDAVAATREVVQAGLQPANCRLLDEAEAALSAGSGGGAHLLVLGFESADSPVDGPMARAVEICAAHRGEVPDGVRASGPDQGTSDAGRQGAVGAWRNAFIRAPYSRDALVAMSMIVETFETACTWDAFDDLHAGVTSAVEKAVGEVCGAGTVTCRFTHVYPDGPAPYFSVMGPGRRGSEVSQWDEIKAAASEAVLSHGGTITHHHAVGRDHRRWYDRQRPALFAEALKAAKAVLDPAGVMNPGVLVDPR